MAQIFCPQLNKTILIKDGENLMKALKSAGLPVASSCGGDGVCAKCRVEVIKGDERLNKPTPLEQRLVDKNQIPAGERISCLTRVFGDIEIRMSYW